MILLRENGLVIEQGRTSKGIVFESYKRKDGCYPSVTFAGFGVRPLKQKDYKLSELKKSTYFGFSHCMLSEKIGQSYIFYQPSVFKSRLFADYSDEDEQKQVDAVFDEIKRKMYIIGHSLGARPAIKILLGYYGKKPNILGGAIIAPFTTVKDSMTNPDIVRKIFQGPFIYLYSLGKYAPGFLFTPSPLRSPKLHTNLEEYVSFWGTAPFLRVSSGKDMLRYDTTKDFQNKDVSADMIAIITNQDHIFAPEKQRAVANGLHAKIYEIEAGHNCFVNDDAAKNLSEIIAKHYDSCMKKRHLTIS